MTQLNVTATLLSNALYAACVSRKGPPTASMGFARELLKELELQQQKREEILRGDDRIVATSDATTITQGELIKALEVTGYGEHSRKSAESWVRTVLEHVREPEFKGGDIVISRSGGTFIKLLGQGSGWRNAATQVEVKYEYPGRPLTKIGVVG